MQQPLVIAVADNATRRVPTWKPGLRSIDVLTRPANRVAGLVGYKVIKKVGKERKMRIKIHSRRHISLNQRKTITII